MVMDAGAKLDASQQLALKLGTSTTRTFPSSRTSHPQQAVTTQANP
jgi:hypothetical protein